MDRIVLKENDELRLYLSEDLTPAQVGYLGNYCQGIKYDARIVVLENPTQEVLNQIPGVIGWQVTGGGIEVDWIREWGWKWLAGATVLGILLAKAFR